MVKGEFLGSGRNRAVYVYNKKYVIKIPLNHNGIVDNQHESFISNIFGRGKSDDGALYARCKLLPNDCLLMERVNPIDYDQIKYLSKEIKYWSSFIDCGQIGFTMDGRVVAYDYGIC